MHDKDAILNAYRGGAEYQKVLLEYAIRGPLDLDSGAWWLKSDFWATQWSCDFGENNRLSVDWDAQLAGGLDLRKRSKISHAFRTWLCIQSHHVVTNGYRQAPRYIYNVINQTIRLIDLFLLSYPHEALCEFGFSSMSGGDFERLLTQLASASNTQSSIYDWPGTVANYLRKLTEATVTLVEFDYYKGLHPLICVVATSEDERLLPGFDDNDIVLARIALMKSGLYKRMRTTPGASWFVPDGKAIRASLYRETLNGRSRRAIIPELCFGDADLYDRERPSVYVRHGDDNDLLSEATLRGYATRLKTLQHLKPFGVAPASEALKALESKRVYKALALAAAGRFKSVPTQHMFFALERAITFYLENEDHLFDSFVAALKAARSYGTPMRLFVKNNDFQSTLLPQTRALGISRPNVKRKFVVSDEGAFMRPLERAEFYDCLRSCQGLLETVRVLYGAIFITTGLLSARRRCELCELDANNFLDGTETGLKFRAAKTGLSGSRMLVVRPIPPLTVRMLKRLSIFQQDLVAAGIIEKTGKLFALPNFSTGITGSGEAAEVAIDSFLDFINMPLDEEGRRYYVRFHQARRFLPQMFMDSGIEGSIGTVQWFLCHTDRKSIWNYLLETSAGDAINQSAAQTATLQLRAGNRAFDELAELVFKTFGVRDFWALSENQLAGYIFTLEQRGDVNVEMEFFLTPEGQRHQMIMKVKKRV